MGSKISKLLQSIEESRKAVDQEITKLQESGREENLLPRRAEILGIIRDHQLVNFDMLRRRFMIINERTLRYDLKKLQDEGFIRKLGNTKGAHYTSVSTKEE